MEWQTRNDSAWHCQGSRAASKSSEPLTQKAQGAQRNANANPNSPVIAQWRGGAEELSMGDAAGRKRGGLFKIHSRAGARGSQEEAMKVAPPSSPPGNAEPQLGPKILRFRFPGAEREYAPQRFHPRSGRTLPDEPCASRSDGAPEGSPRLCASARKHGCSARRLRFLCGCRVVCVERIAERRCVRRTGSCSAAFSGVLRARPSRSVKNPELPRCGKIFPWRG
jgi:hypothetical protein